MADDDADSPRSAVSVSEAPKAVATAAHDLCSPSVAHTIHFWEHISPPAKLGDGLCRAHSAPDAARRLPQAVGRGQVCTERQMHQLLSQQR